MSISKQFLSLLLVLVLVAGFTQFYISPNKVQAEGVTVFPPLYSGIEDTVGNGFIQATATDFNSDSHLDLAAVNTGSNTVSVAQNSVTTLRITTNALKDGEVYASYSMILQAINGVPPYKWSKIGSWPTGLTLNAKTGVISGKPSLYSTTAKKYSITIRVTDSAPKGHVQTVSKTFTMTIYPQLDIARLPNADARSPYSCNLSASGGKPPYSWAKDTTWPVWLSLNPSTGTLSGTPPTKGLYRVGLLLTDSLGYTLAKTLTITVNSPLVILNSVMPDGTSGVAYSHVLSASGGSGGYKFSIEGALPSWLNFNSKTATFSGIPVDAGTYTLKVKVTDSINCFVIQSMTLTIATDGGIPLSRGTTISGPPR